MTQFGPGGASRASPDQIANGASPCSAALFADSPNLRRRVPRSVSVPRLDALGGTHQSIPRECSLHGHAHNGALEGATATGIPVHNVSIPALQKHAPNESPFR